MMMKLYNKLRYKIHQITSVEGQIRKLVFENRRACFEDKILNSTKKGITDEKYCQYDIIVSLTTYGRRLQDVCFTIESIMQQTMLPNKIILNIDKSISIHDIPHALRMQQKRGLEIAFVEDIRSYTKLIPTLSKYPEAIIITIDDDVLYNFDIVERLFQSYVKYPDKISALRVHTIKFDKDKKPRKYMEWDMCKADSSNPMHLFLTGVGGVLYPPHSLYGDVLDKDVFMSICPTADDVWFHAMAVKNGTGIVKVPTRSELGQDYITNDDVQDMGLFHVNTGGAGRNDLQIKAVYEKYGIYELLK